MSDELRAHPRCPVSLSAEVRVGQETLAAATVDLSLGGVGLMMRSPLREGHRVRLSVFLTQDGIEDPDTPPLEVPAKVAWVAPSDDGSHRAGLRFESVDVVMRMQLQDLLRSLELAA